MGYAATFNLFEGIMWIAIAALFIFVPIFKLEGDFKIRLVIGAIFILFGISDFVEITTGAWWRP